MDRGAHPSPLTGRLEGAGLGSHTAGTEKRLWAFETAWSFTCTERLRRTEPDDLIRGGTVLSERGARGDEP
ncbi:hypothetical protein JZ751_028973 [Albula glossodonta]|uniref:Uncharacterized protein n=1 Tax=Albula glossodonta TaxID=121402 RepID=A0A8T2PAA8_9TELE|nr:hypothetical protein JZ751_028973 [Albula glossodonta]